MYPLGCWCLHLTPSFFRHKVWTEDKEECIQVNKKPILRNPPRPTVSFISSPTNQKLRKLQELPRLREKQRTLWKKRDREWFFFFFTYERCRRRLPSIKMINGADEVFVLLSSRWITNSCFESIVLRVSKVRLFIREKIRLVSWHTTKRRRTANQKYLAKKCFNKSVWGFWILGFSGWVPP